MLQDPTGICCHPKKPNAEEKSETKLLLDVDAEDQCEYKEDIWKNLLEQESQRPTIHLQSPQLEFRGALVQQLREASRSLGLSICTLHAAVAHLDLFMDAHRLRDDRLTHVALACLSLAAKSEEKFNQAPTLKTLTKISGVHLCGKTFRQLEWMVGQHLRWKLLAPTPVTFAALIAHCVVTAEDLTTRHPKFVRKFKRDGAKLLEAYLDLTLSDVRLKVVDAVDAGCACVACARAELGLAAWPPWLAAATSRKAAAVAPVARLLQRMMRILKCREEKGYSGAQIPPIVTPCDNGDQTPSDAAANTYCEHDAPSELHDDGYSVLELADRAGGATAPAVECRLPSAGAGDGLQRANSAADYRYIRSSRLLEASLEARPPPSAAVKRTLESSAELDAKRYRLTAQMSQVCLL